MPSPSDPELLTVEQFADRLQVSRATIFAWMQKKILIQGQHFLRLGRVLRFPWSPDLVAGLLAVSAQTPPVAPPSLSPVLAPRKKRPTVINWDY
jgi:predicted DNA-binding transcriptional regulator AlpA